MSNAPEFAGLPIGRLAAAARSLEADMVRFLRDLIAIPAESGREGPVIRRIREEGAGVSNSKLKIQNSNHGVSRRPRGSLS